MKNSELIRADTTGNPTHAANPEKLCITCETYVRKKKQASQTETSGALACVSMAFGVCMHGARKITEKSQSCY